MAETSHVATWRTYQSLGHGDDRRLGRGHQRVRRRNSSRFSRLQADQSGISVLKGFIRSNAILLLFIFEDLFYHNQCFPKSPRRFLRFFTLFLILKNWETLIWNRILMKEFCHYVNINTRYLIIKNSNKKLSSFKRI